MLHMQPAGVGEYRHWAPARALARRGHDVFWVEDYASLMDSAFQTLAERHPTERLDDILMHETNGADVLHVGYTTLEEHLTTFVALRRYSKAPLVVDIDDDIENVPKYNVAFKAYHGGAIERRIARATLRLADAVTVTTVPLKEALLQHNEHIYVLPNYHDQAAWYQHARTTHEAILERRDSRKTEVRMMFAGGHGRYGDITLDPVVQALRTLLRRYRHLPLRLFFVGCTPDWALEFMPSTTDPSANQCFSVPGCSLPLYRRALAYIAPDIMISPVETNTFNASKSLIKAYDAAECGAAFVCTDWPTYADLPKETCWKVDNTEAQWQYTLEAAIEDVERRRAKAQELRRWVLTNRRIDDQIYRWEDAYSAITSRPARDLDEEYRRRQVVAP